VVVMVSKKQTRVDKVVVVAKRLVMPLVLRLVMVTMVKLVTVAVMVVTPPVVCWLIKKLDKNPNLNQLIKVW